MTFPPGLSERVPDDLLGQLRSIAFVGEVSQHDAREPRMKEFEREASSCLIRKVPVARRDPAAHGNGVGARVEEDLVVVRFQNQQVTTRQSVPDLSGRAPQIGGYSESKPGALVHECDTDRIRRIVHGEEWLHSHIPDDERPTGVVFNNRLVALEERRTCGARPGADVDGGSMTTCEYADSARVVTVLVRHDDGVDLFGGDGENLKASGHVSGTEAGIDEDAGVAGVDVGRVAGRATPKDGDLHV